VPRAPPPASAWRRSPPVCAASSSSLGPPHGSKPCLREGPFAAGRPRGDPMAGRPTRGDGPPSRRGSTVPPWRRVRPHVGRPRGFGGRRRSGAATHS
jgi:hypothetical protein